MLYTYWRNPHNMTTFFTLIAIVGIIGYYSYSAVAEYLLWRAKKGEIRHGLGDAMQYMMYPIIALAIFLAVGLEEGASDTKNAVGVTVSILLITQFLFRAMRGMVVED